MRPLFSMEHGWKQVTRHSRWSGPDTPEMGARHGNVTDLHYPKPTDYSGMSHCRKSMVISVRLRSPTSGGGLRITLLRRSPTYRSDTLSSVFDRDTEQQHALLVRARRIARTSAIAAPLQQRLHVACYYDTQCPICYKRTLPRLASPENHRQVILLYVITCRGAHCGARTAQDVLNIWIQVSRFLPACRRAIHRMIAARLSAP